MIATVVIRPFNPSQDEPFIYTTWRDSLWFENNPSKENLTFPKEDPHARQFSIALNKKIKKLLGRSGVKVRVACMSDNSDHIVGFSVFKEKHIHWVYVKYDYRNSGIGKLLSSGFETVAPPLTKFGRTIVNNKELKVVSEKS